MPPSNSILQLPPEASEFWPTEIFRIYAVLYYLDSSLSIKIPQGTPSFRGEVNAGSPKG